MLLKKVAQEKHTELGFEAAHDPGGGIENLGVAGGTGDIRDEGVLVTEICRERGVVGVGEDGQNGFFAEGFLTIGDELDGGAFAHGSNKDVLGIFRNAEGPKQVGDHLPRAWRGEALLGFFHVEKEFLARAEETEDERVDVRIDSPFPPVVEVDLVVEVDEAVRKRGGHAKGDGGILGTVACGKDAPFFGKHIFAYATVERELVEAGLDEGRSGIEFVEKEDAFGVGIMGKKAGRAPAGFVAAHCGDSSQVGWIEERGSDVEELELSGIRDLANNGGFSDPWWAPNEGGPTGGNNVINDLGDSAGFHGKFSNANSSHSRGEGSQLQTASLWLSSSSIGAGGDADIQMAKPFLPPMTAFNRTGSSSGMESRTRAQ